MTTRMAARSYADRHRSYRLHFVNIQDSVVNPTSKYVFPFRDVHDRSGRVRVLREVRL